jgi:hypothetical protein
MNINYTMFYDFGDDVYILSEEVHENLRIETEFTSI